MRKGDVMFQKYKALCLMYYTTKQRYSLINEYYGLSKEQVNMNHPLLKAFSYGSSFMVIIIAFGLSNYGLAALICVIDLLIAPLIFGYTLQITANKIN